MMTDAAQKTNLLHRDDWEIITVIILLSIFPHVGIVFVSILNV